MTQKIKILFIEDDESIREMYKIKFASCNIPLATAVDGIEGLAMARKLKPDILLLDIKIPHLGGEEVLEELLKEGWSSNMVIVVMSNINQREAPKILQTERIDHYIVKAHRTPSEVITLVKEISAKKATSLKHNLSQ